MSDLTSEHIKEVLADESSLGLTFASNLFIGRMPTKPNECVTIYDTGSTPEFKLENDGENYEYVSVAIRIRDNEYLDAWNLGNDIIDLLDGHTFTAVDGTEYVRIKPVTGPLFIGRDENRRPLLSINIAAQRNPVT
jgi:hypothetical protein